MMAARGRPGSDRGSRRAELHTLAGPYALDALPPRDRARFERHLAACESCAHEVRGLMETAGRLADATAAPLPPGLRERVLAEAARTRQLPPVLGKSGLSRGWARRSSWPRIVRPAWPLSLALGRPLGRPLRLGLAAVLAVAALAFGGLAVVSQHHMSQLQARDHLLAAVLTAPDAKMMTARAASGGTATIVVSEHMGALAFSSAGLPALPDQMGYELWLMGPSGDHPAAMLPAPQHGMTSPVVATGLRAGDKLGLTVEPSGGAPRPTSTPILLVAVFP